MMDVLDLIFVCVIALATGSLGWVLGRFMAPTPPRSKPDAPGQRDAAAKALSPSPTRRARPSITRPGQRRFAACVEVSPPSRAGVSALEQVDREALERIGVQLSRQLEGCDGLRIGDRSLDFCFVAPNPRSAQQSLGDALRQIDADPGLPGLASDCEIRAAIVDIGDGQASHAAFRAASDRLRKVEAHEARVVFADSSTVSQGVDSDIDFARRLMNALKTNEATLHYQPKLDVREARFHSAEALFRWSPAGSDPVTISELIKISERLGFIEDLTLWSLERATTDQLLLLDHGIELKTFVNLSGQLLSDSEFTLRAIDILKSASGRIGLEITETSVIGNQKRALANLELYSAAGAEIAIDDYGTGLSSLRYLKRIPAQELKVDREFIMDLTNSHRDPMIVRSTIDLAHALGLRVTAEGVDDPTKMALLKVMGCDLLQGFHIARPMPLTDLIDFMHDTERQKSLIESKVSLLSSTGGVKNG